MNKADVCEQAVRIAEFEFAYRVVMFHSKKKKKTVQNQATNHEIRTWKENMLNFHDFKTKKNNSNKIKQSSYQ